MHPNPNVKKIAEKYFTNLPNVKLIAPLDYPEFVTLMNNSYLIITDSGGIQEEAPSLGKPVIIMREKTERQEGVDSGTVFLQGSSKDMIVSKTLELLNDKNLYQKVSNTSNPYGDGNTALRVTKHLQEVL